MSGCDRIRVKPSPALTVDCQTAATPITTYRSLALRELEWQKAAEECTGRMRAIRK